MKDKLIAEIKALATEYEMVLDWPKINRADITELNKILGMIKRVYANRAI
jgi:hypothetical protein